MQLASEPPSGDLPPPPVRAPFGGAGPVGSFWRRAWKGLSSGGAEYAFTAALSYLPCWLLRYRHHALFVCEDGVRAARHSETLVTVLDDERDAERLSGHSPLTRAEVEERLRRGDVCAVASENGRVLASAWAAVGDRYLIGLGRPFRIPSGAFYIHDALTEPDARRRGLATRCYQQMFEHFASMGRRTAYAAVEVLNHPSIAAHARWGFHRVGQTRKFRLPKLIVTTCRQWPTPGRLLLLGTPEEAQRYPPA